VIEPSPKNQATPLRPVRLGPRDFVLDQKPDGTIHLRSPHPLGPYPERLTDRLLHWAREAPDRILFAQRNGAGWRAVTYAETVALVRNVGEALLQWNLSAERPVAILSGNDIDHALLALGCQFAGIPSAPISPAYSLVSSDFGKLRHIIQKITPGLVFASDGTLFGKAIDAELPADAELVVARNPARNATPFSELAGTRATDAIDQAQQATGPDTIVKFLFTSGSTGMPKGVINTQRMWCANQEMLRTAMAYFADEPAMLVDWAPWHHTAGGNHNFGLAIYNGGTFYIDEGKPMPGAIEATARNLRDVSPTWYFNVPKGFEALLPYLRDDKTLRESFFRRLRVMFYAGAGLSRLVLDEYQAMSAETCGERILFLTSLGATETGPFALVRTWDSPHAGNIGLPGVGMELKLVPQEGKYDARIKGPHVSPGYWREPGLTTAAFDTEGFYRFGDALRFADPEDPGEGLCFDGRIAEDFKLATGTWVSVGPLRAKLIDAFAPLCRDVVIAGADRSDIAALVFPDLDACRGLCGLQTQAGAADILAASATRTAFADRLARFARAATGSSNRVTRLILLAEPPSLDLGEITDKGSINQRAVLRARAALVEELYESGARVIAAE
jgi:feruloyl-CoA synthase